MSIFRDNLSAFGLDLSDRSIKVAQLRKKRGKINLFSYGREDISKGLIVNGEIKNEEEVVRLIKKTLSNAKPNPIKSKFVIYSIPEPKGFIRVVRIPYSKKDDIEQAVRYEAEQLFPIDINEAYVDWQILPSDNDKILKIIVSAVPRLLVDSYSLVAEEAGLKPVAAEIESIPITRSLINKDQSSKPILVVDLGKDRTSFIIFKNPAVQFTASIPVCGEEFIHSISERLGIDEIAAENMKNKCGLRFEGECKEVFKAIQPSLREMIKYINKLTYYYKEHFESDEDIAKVIICGGEAKMVGISSFLSLQIKKEIEKGNPWVNIMTFKDKEIPLISRTDSLVFVTVLGLALRGIQEE
ncbi:MAG: type IV pilus assembly protein PilM [Candidatus Pacebacteria bacterium]|nr:type IV pilus assembly protein PilM [Candidatus Paceibacterota bacterium]